MADAPIPLAVVPPPEHDELISSWLARVGRFYGLSAKGPFAENGVALGAIDLAAIDIGIPRSALKPVARLLGVRMDQLFERVDRGLLWRWRHGGSGGRSGWVFIRHAVTAGGLPRLPGPTTLGAGLLVAPARVGSSGSDDLPTPCRATDRGGPRDRSSGLAGLLPPTLARSTANLLDNRATSAGAAGANR